MTSRKGLNFECRVWLAELSGQPVNLAELGIRNVARSSSPSDRSACAAVGTAS